MRHDWAQAWSRLLAPGGELITLMFPVGPGYVGNPPWQVSPELYQELLLPAGVEIISHYLHLVTVGLLVFVMAVAGAGLDLCCCCML